jgi:hypothetical protein
VFSAVKSLVSLTLSSSILCFSRPPVLTFRSSDFDHASFHHRGPS